MPHGAYRTHRLVAAERLVPLPEGIDPITIAGSLLKGLDVVNTRPLREAASAHAALEARQTTGSSILIV